MKGLYVGEQAPRLLAIEKKKSFLENLAIAKMKLLSLATFFSIMNGALRFGCSTVSIQSLDPVVQPGVIPSAHLHKTLVAMRSKQT